MTFAARDLKDVANRVARKLEDYMNNERRETRFQPAGCFRTTKKMQNYDLLTRVMETSDLDYVPTANMKRKKSPGRRSPRNKSPEGKMKKMPKSRKKDASKERTTVKKHKSGKTEEKNEETSDQGETDRRGEVETKKEKETKIVKKETWMRLIDADVEKSSDHKLKIVPKLEKTSRTIVAKKEAARLSEYASHVFENAYKSPKEDVYSIDLKPLQEEQPLDKLQVIHRYRPNSMDVAHVTENGKVQNYTCHFGSALHAKKYVDYYMREGLQTGKKEYSKRLQQLRTRDTSSDKGSERSSVRTVASASYKNKEYSGGHSEKTRGMLPPIHSSSSDLGSPRSNHSVHSSDSVMSGFSRYTSSSFSSGLPSAYKIVSKPHCPPSITVQPGQSTRHSYPEPHPPLSQSADLDFRCSSRNGAVQRMPLAREAFAEQTDGKKPYIQSLMLDRASSTTDLLPMLNTFTQTPRNDERELSILDSVISASDIFVNQETQTPRSSIHSGRRKKKRKKHHSKDRNELQIDVDDGDRDKSGTRRDVRTGRRNSRHMGTSSVSDLDVSRTDNDNNTYDGNTSTTTSSFLKKPEKIAKVCQTSFSLASESLYPDPLSENTYPYSSKTTNMANMNESLLLQSVEGDNDFSSLPNSTVHLYKSSQDQEPSDSLFDYEEQNARYADSGVLEENRADVGNSEDYYSYDRAGEKVPENEKSDNRNNSLTAEHVEKVNELDDCPQNESTPCQSDNECFWETRGDKGVSFEGKDQTGDVDVEDMDDKNELLSPVSRNTHSRTASPREESVILIETPRKNETLEPSPEQDIGKMEESVVNDLKSESVEEVCRGSVEMPAVDEDPRGDTQLSEVDEAQENYLGNFNKSFHMNDPAVYQKLSSEYMYVPEERGSDGESFVDSEPEPEVYTKPDPLLQKDINDDKTEINIEICRGAIPPKRKESNASSYCSVTRAVGDTFPIYLQEQFDRPNSSCSQVTSTRGSGKSQKDHESRPQSAQNGKSKQVLDETQDLLDEEEIIGITKCDDTMGKLPVQSASSNIVEKSPMPDRSSSRCSRGSSDNMLIDLNTTLRGQDGQMNNDSVEMNPQAIHTEDNDGEGICNSTGSRGIQTEVVSQLISKEAFVVEDAVKKDDNGQEVLEEGYGEEKDPASVYTSENEHTSDTSSCRGAGGKVKSDSVVSSRGLDEDISFEHLDVKHGREESSDYGSMVLRTEDSSSGQVETVQEADKQHFAKEELAKQADTFESSRGVAAGEDSILAQPLDYNREDDTESFEIPANEENIQLKDDLFQDLQENDDTLEMANMGRLDVSEIPNDSMCVIGGIVIGNDLSNMSIDMDTESCMKECDNEEKKENILIIQENSTSVSGTQRPSSAHSPQNSPASLDMARPQSARPLATSLIEKPVFKESSENVKSDKVSAKSEEVLDEDTYVVARPNGEDSILNESRGQIEYYTGVPSQSNNTYKQREKCINEEPDECGNEHVVDKTSSKDVSDHIREDAIYIDIERKEAANPEKDTSKHEDPDSLTRIDLGQETGDNNTVLRHAQEHAQDFRTHDQTTEVKTQQELETLKIDTELNLEARLVETGQELETSRIDPECTQSALSSERGEATNSPRIAHVPIVKQLDRSPSVCSRGSVSEDNDDTPDIQVSDIRKDPSDPEAQDEIGSGQHETGCKTAEDFVKHVEKFTGEESCIAEDKLEVVTAVGDKEPLESDCQSNKDQNENTDELLSKFQRSATHRGSITHRDAVLGTNLLEDVLATYGSNIIERKEKERSSEEEDLEAVSNSKEDSSPCEGQHPESDLKEKPQSQEIKADSENQTKTKHEESDALETVKDTPGTLQEESVKDFTTEGQHFDGDFKVIPSEPEIKADSENQTKTKHEESDTLETVKDTPGTLQEESLNDFTTKGPHFDGDFKVIPSEPEIKTDSENPTKTKQEESEALETIKDTPGALQEESVKDFTTEGQHFDGDFKEMPSEPEVKTDSDNPMKTKQEESEAFETVKDTPGALQEESVNNFTTEGQLFDDEIPTGQEIKTDSVNQKTKQEESKAHVVKDTPSVLQKESVNEFTTEDQHFDGVLKEIPPGKEIKTDAETRKKTKHEETETLEPVDGTHDMLQKESLNFFTNEDQHSHSNFQNIPLAQEIEMDSKNQEKTEVETVKSVENIPDLLQKESVNFFDASQDAGETQSSSLFTEDQTVLQSTMLSDDITLLPSSLDTMDDSTDSSTTSETETTSTPESIQYIRTEDMPSTQLKQDSSEVSSKEQYKINQAEEATSVRSTEYEQNPPRDKDGEVLPNYNETISPESKIYDEVSEAEKSETVRSSPASGVYNDTSIMSSDGENQRYSLESRGSQNYQPVPEESKQSSRGDDTLSTVDQTMLLSERSPMSETYINGSPLVTAESVVTENAEDEKLTYCNLASPQPPCPVEETQVSHGKTTANEDDDTQISEKFPSDDLLSPSNMVTDSTESTTFVMSADTPSFVPTQEINTDRNDYHLVLNDEPESSEDLQGPALKKKGTEKQHVEETHIEELQNRQTENSIETEKIQERQSGEEQELPMKIIEMSPCPKTVLHRVDGIVEEASSAAKATISGHSCTVNTDSEKIPDIIPAEPITPTQLESDNKQEPCLTSEQHTMMTETNETLENALDIQNREASGSSIDLTEEKAKAIPGQKVILVSEKNDIKPVNSVLEPEAKTDSHVSQYSKSDLALESGSVPTSVTRPVVPTEGSHDRSGRTENSQQEGNKPDQTDVVSENVLDTGTSLERKAAELGDEVVTNNMTESETASRDESNIDNAHILNTEDTQRLEGNPDGDSASEVGSSSGRRMSKSGNPPDTCQQSDNQTPGHRIILVSENIPSPITEAKVIERSPGGPRVILVSEKSQN